MKAKPTSSNPPPAPSSPPAAGGNPDATFQAVAQRQLQLGWWSLLGFLTLGVVLESLHGFKVGYYLNVSNETRRLMWTLAHAHGTLIAIVQIVFGLTVRTLPRWDSRRRALAARCLTGAGWLIPGGFFLGGVFVYGGDPGLGVLLVPVGALLLFVGVFLTARGFQSNLS